MRNDFEKLTQKQMDYITENCSPIDVDARYNDFLDEAYPDLKIAGYSYCTSTALQEIDPTAYRCGFSDWLDMESRDDRIISIEAEYYDTDEADDALDELQEQIEAEEEKEEAELNQMLDGEDEAESEAVK